MSLQAVGMLMTHPVMSPTLRGVALLIADCHNGETGLCCPSIGYLSKRSGMTARGMQKNIKKLKDLGVILVHEHFADGRQTANTYDVLPYSANRREPQGAHEGELQDSVEGEHRDTQNQEYINQEYKPKTDMSGKPDAPPPSKPAKPKSKKSKPLPPIADAEEILEHLNGATTRRFRSRTNDGELSTHITLIRTRLKSHTKADLIAMVAHRVWKWLNDPRMTDYLRPETLFSLKNCTGYVDAALSPNAYQTDPGNHPHAKQAATKPQTLVERVQQSFDQQQGTNAQQPYIDGECSAVSDPTGYAVPVGQDDAHFYAQMGQYCDE